MPRLISPCSHDFISQRWGSAVDFYKQWGYSSGHNGIDFASSAGTPIVSVADGVVSVVNWDPNGYGSWCEVSHAAIGGKTRYAHMLRGSIQVGAGDVITAGTALGQMGSTGASTGPHLHWELRMADPKLGVPGMKGCVDPMPFLPEDIGGGGLEIGEEGGVEDEMAKLQSQIGLLNKAAEQARGHTAELARIKGLMEWGLQELLNVQLAANVNDVLTPPQAASVENVRIEVEKARGNI